jgi:hypothetical protein
MVVEAGAEEDSIVIVVGGEDTVIETEMILSIQGQAITIRAATRTITAVRVVEDIQVAVVVVVLMVHQEGGDSEGVGEEILTNYLLTQFRGHPIPRHQTTAGTEAGTEAGLEVMVLPHHIVDMAMVQLREVDCQCITTSRMDEMTTMVDLEDTVGTK